MLRTLCVFYVFLLLVGCSPYKTLVVKNDLDAHYQAAVKDASAPKPNEIDRALVPVVDYNLSLKKNDKGQVLVATWTSWNGYDKIVGQDMKLTREAWVTTAPQLSNFCQNLSLDSAKMVLRLEQLLGLPPHNGKNRFVEMWVNPSDLFRPCPDPEISDEECELKTPTSPYFTIAEEHQKWIDNLRANSYGEKGYPWTQLGYTYDWGNPKNHVGLSEFVIRPGATITVKGVSDVYEYCGAKR
jgi:hypothetical protein